MNDYLILIKKYEFLELFFQLLEKIIYIKYILKVIFLTKSKQNNNKKTTTFNMIFVLKKILLALIYA